MMKPNRITCIAIYGWLTISCTSVLALAEARNSPPTEVVFDGEKIALTTSKTGNHSLVSGNFGIGEELKFILDTGAAASVIDRGFARVQGFEVLRTQEVGAPGGPTVTAPVVRVPFLQVGELTITNGEFLALDITKMSNGLTQGVLGMPLFKDYLLTFDHGNQQIVVSRGSLAKSDQGVIAFTATQAPVQIDIKVAGQSLPTHIDTGSPMSFTLPADWIDKLTLKDNPVPMGNARFVGGEREVQGGQLVGDVEFAGLTYSDPEMVFISPMDNHGNIGSGVIDDLVLTIDQKNQLLRIKPTLAKAYTQKSQSRRRLGVQFRGYPGGGEMQVVSVEANALGERVGFRAGDTLVWVNGKPLTEYDMSTLGSLISGSKPLVFGIDRDGEAVSIDVP